MKQTSTAFSILKIMSEDQNGSFFSSYFVEKLGIHADTAQSNLKKLFENGDVTRERKGAGYEYRISSKGLELMEQPQHDHQEVIINHPTNDQPTGTGNRTFVLRTFPYGGANTHLDRYSSILNRHTIGGRSNRQYFAIAETKIISVFLSDSPIEQIQQELDEANLENITCLVSNDIDLFKGYEDERFTTFAGIKNNVEAMFFSLSARESRNRTYEAAKKKLNEHFTAEEIAALRYNGI